MAAKNSSRPGQEIVITRRFNAPRELLFATWTDPRHLARWWGPAGFTNPVCQWDARVGGKIHDVMRGPDGTEYPMGGKFRELVAPEKLVMTCGALDGKGALLFEFEHTVTFAGQDGVTTVTIRSRLLSASAGAEKYTNGYRAGMTQSLERLAELAEDTASREIVITRVVDAPRELVWLAWTDPRHVVHWWGPRGFSTKIKRMDFRIGGVWEHVMCGPDGVNYPNKSTFKDIVPLERITYAHGGGREDGPGASFQATWTFETVAGGKTRLTGRMVFPTAEARDFVAREFGAVEGGRQTLERLGEFLVRMPVVIERDLAAPIAAVWSALTDVTQMKKWYMEELSAFEPVVGFETQFNVHHEGKDFLHHWKVAEVVAGRKISYAWTFPKFPGQSLVTFELSAVAGRTHLVLTHTGLETFRADQHPDLAVAKFQSGWTSLVESLQGFVATNPPPAAKPFVITRVFAAPRELVWQAWTEAGHLARWFGPKGFTTPVARLDFRPGGMFHYCQQSPDGKQLWGRFVYREIAPPERIVWVNSFSDESGGVGRHPFSATWPQEMLTVVTFAGQAGKTTVTVTWTALNATPAEQQTFDSSHDGMIQGWNGTFDQLAAYLAKA
jgi:uncharacterized protein YndB with AHSA1/START domain